MGSSVRFVVVPFVVTRFALFAVGVVAVRQLPINPAEARSFRLPPQPHSFLEAWARYDACWYVTIAERGYRGEIPPGPDLRAGFFPLFPMLIRAFAYVSAPPLLAALIVSNASLLGFLFVLWGLVEREWGADVARRSVLIYLLFPTAFFLSGAYSESVALLLSAAAVLAARQRRWRLAAVVAASATLARPLGCLAILPVAIEYVGLRRHERLATWTPSLAALFAPTSLASAGYLVFAAWTFGDPWAFGSEQAVMRGPLTPPWVPFVAMLRAGPRFHSYDSSMVDAALAVVAIASLPLIHIRVGASYALFAALVVLIPLSGSLVSFNRLLLPSFPHAILLATCVSARPTFAAMAVAFAASQALLMAAFATWHWIG